MGVFSSSRGGIARRWWVGIGGLAACALLPYAAALHAQASLPLLRPSAVAYDSAGDLFIADADRNQVFEISLAGARTVVAGNGVQGFAGDGGAASASELNAPQGLAVGSDGTIYIADTGNQRIRSVENGTISTIAGGSAGFSGDGGPAAAAELDDPAALALDSSGALLLCDRGNQRIRRVSHGVITTLAGNGVAGFAGDGGSATAAELNQPSGLAVGADGRIYIADTANQRIRAIAPNGTITTFAGTGVAGFSGDGGVATSAQLNRPEGLAIDATGALLIGDQNNQRLRTVSASGIIATIAGTGVQGTAADGTVATSAALNLPGGVAVSVFGWPLVAEPGNHALRVLLDDGKVYRPGATALQGTAVSQTFPAVVYGSATDSMAVASNAGTPRGSVQVFDGAEQVGQGTLTQGFVVIPLPQLSAGSHTLSGVYNGDGVHPTATTNSSVTILPAPVTASASGITVSYGAPLPNLSGTLSGVLAQDAGKVTAVFSAAVPNLPAVGSYPITATLTGPASENYQLSLASSSGSLTVVPAASTTTLSPPANAYSGLPLQLSATVASTTQGVPTGSVQFFDGGTLVASAKLANGSATAIDLAPASGSHLFTASYSGDSDFLASNSAKMTATVAPMPDFDVSASGVSKQTIVAGSTATYTLNVASQGAPFTGVVTMSASGLPSGATASFSPPAVVPGSSTAAVTLTISTPLSESSSRIPPRSGYWPVLGLLGLPLLSVKRRRSLGALLTCLIAAATLLGLAACGARMAPESALPVQSYAITVTATSTNLAGGVVVHSATLTMGVE